MKLTFLFLLAGFMSVSASTLAQKVTLNATDANLKTVLKELKKQSGYDFVVDEQVLDHAKPITLHLSNMDINIALDQLFDDEDLAYTIEDKVVTIKERQSGLVDKLKSVLNLDKIDVHGTVVDETSLPLVSATVIIKGTGNSTLTDAKGVFNLKNVDPNATVVITFVGFNKQELPAKSEMGMIKMAQATSGLDAVQIIAYGQQTERLSVGDITTVGSKTIGKEPITNVLQALDGQVPGLQIVQPGSMPGTPYPVQIRGDQSIANGTAPFYVIDGVSYMPFTGVISTVPYDPLNFINPSDIESISILKDADATAIYGSQAANGAILITTKKGKAGKTRLDVIYRQGVEYAPQNIQWMNTQQYLQMRRQAFANDGIVPNAGNAPDLLQFDTTRYTNWSKFLTGNAAQYKDIQASISGGNANTQFLFGGNYHEQSTVFPFSESIPHADVHFNITNTSLDNRFKLSVTSSYSVTTTHLPQQDLTQYINLPPNLPPLYNKDGSLDLVRANFGYAAGNPLAYQLQQAYALTNNLVANAVLSYELLKNLKLSASLGYTNSVSNNNSIDPIASLDPSIPETGSATFNTSNTSSWIAEPQLTYQLQGNWGRLDALAGATFEEMDYSTQSLNGSGYTSDVLITDIQAAPTITSGGLSTGEYKYNALFGRLNYNYKDRYIADITWRRDGSSRFGADNAIHDFASAGGAWIFSNEKLFADHLSWLSFGKLRVSYGTTGNDQIGDYRYDNLYSLTRVPYQGVIGLTPKGLPSVTLEWEETRKLEAGLELGFLKDRILANVNWYRDRSSNQLLSENLPSITGFNSVTRNLPATVQNTGWEMELKTTNVQSGHFTWKTTFNFTANVNKLISFPGLANSPYANRDFIGYPINITKVFKYLDVNPQTGLYEFLGANGQPTSNPNNTTDRTAFSPGPSKFYGGFGNTFSYKGLEVSVFFKYEKQMGINPILTASNVPGNLFSGNMPLYMTDAWQQPGEVTNIEKYTTGLSSQAANVAWADARSSTNYFVDASFIRLNNLSVSYALDTKWTQRFKLRSVRVFLQGQNLWTITGYKGADPEAQYVTLPPLRVFVAGMSVSL